MLLDGIFKTIPLFPRNSGVGCKALIQCRLKTLGYSSVLLGVRLGGGVEETCEHTPGRASNRESWQTVPRVVLEDGGQRLEDPGGQAISWHRSSRRGGVGREI